MAAPSNATPAYANAGYEQPYYHHDAFWPGQPPVGYNLPPLTDLANASGASSSSSTSYEAPDPMQSMYYTMPSYYMPSLASMTSYADPAALAAAAAAGSYAAPVPPGPGDAPHPLNSFYLQQQQQAAPVPISQSMMTTPSYAMPTQISPPTPHYDYATMGYSPAAGGGMGVRTNSSGQLQQSTSAGAAAAAPPAPAAVKKKCGKKPKIDVSAPASVRSAGDSEDFDENETEDDHDRRKLNNIRERVRVKDINNAFHELGHMVNQVCEFDNAGVTMEKQQTKLGILHNAVELIKNLEEQVKRRNLARNMANGPQIAGPPQKPFPPNLQVPPNC